MKYFVIEPEVAGNIANSEFIDRSARPPKIARLKYEFDGWLGDDIVESILTFIITDRFKEALGLENFTGYEIDVAETSVSDQFEELYPDKKLPPFSWLKITGKPGEDDFGISTKNRLVISERIYNLLGSLNTSGADIEEIN